MADTVKIVATGNGEFAFERLDVYRVAREALVVMVRYRRTLKELPGGVGDQMLRAAVSVIANLTEGVGRRGGADRKNRFAIARAEANEAGAMVELAAVFGVFTEDDHRLIRSCLQRVTYMLTAMMR